MSGLKGLKVGGIAAVALAAIIGGLLVVSQVSGASHAVDIHDGSAAPGGQATVELGVHDITDPGLGAWTIDITYDPAVISVVDCAPEAGGVCNPAFGADVIRVTGASATGLEGDTALAAITFECGDDEGSSDLTIAINVLADATIGDPQDIDAAVGNGTFTCEEAVVVAATDTPVVTGPPPTGTAGPSNGTSLLWVVGVLAAIGAAGVMGFGALRIRSRA